MTIFQRSHLWPLDLKKQPCLPGPTGTLFAYFHIYFTIWIELPFPIYSVTSWCDNYRKLPVCHALFEVLEIRQGMKQPQIPAFLELTKWMCSIWHKKGGPYTESWKQGRGGGGSAGMGWLLLLSGGWSVKVYLKRRCVEGLGEEECSRQRERHVQRSWGRSMCETIGRKWRSQSAWCRVSK